MSRAGNYGIKRVDAFQEHINELFLKNKAGGDEITYSYEKDIEPFLLKTYTLHRRREIYDISVGSPARIQNAGLGYIEKTA